jgi:hypothetical protein
MSTYGSENKKYHDINMAAESRARKLRNAIGGVTVAVYGVANVINEFVERFIPRDTASGIAVGALIGITGGIVSKQHLKVRRTHESAVRFAAYEVCQSEYEQTTPPDWALYTLQEENETSEQILSPARS